MNLLNLFKKKDKIVFHDVQNPSMYLLIKDLPAPHTAKAGQKYSNFGCSSWDTNHYPIFYQGTNLQESLAWDGKPIQTKLIENNPEYFEKIK